jgi:ParB-like chromosome segregation protein Spo0J
MNVKLTTLETLLAMPVHPMAERFPMWPADRLEELAADIKANGLNIPIVVWRTENMLLDGRNRLAACKLANVEPRVEYFEGDDPRALIISRNIQTREMTASQKAMLLALEFPETKQGKRNDLTSLESKEVAGFSPTLLSQARLIKRYAGDQVDGVITGATRFNTALRQAEENRSASSATNARLERMEAAAPDLARQVREETLSLGEAEAALNERQRREREIKEAGRRAVAEITSIQSTVIKIQMARDLKERIHIDRESVAIAAEAVALLQGMLLEQDSGERQ